MALSQIPNLASATALSGTELYESVQSGVTVKVNTAQIAAFTQAQYPAPGVSSVTGVAPISTTGSTAVTVSLQTAGVDNTHLAGMNAGTVKANVTGSPAQPSDATPSAVLDLIGATRGDILYRGTSGWAVLPPASTAGYILTNNGTGTDPSWGLPTTFSSITVSAPLNLSGSNISLNTVTVPFGGTGQTSYTTGDLLFASSTTALSKLADIATGNALISGGVGVAPSWGKIGLTTHVSGTLSIASGGTNNTSYTMNGVGYFDGTKFNSVAAGTTGQVLAANTGAAPTWSNLSAFGVTSISFGTTGLTPNSASTGVVTVAGTLVPANGGTGLTGFTAANNAIYSTSSSALTAGTLPILAGGTGSTTATGTGSVVLQASPSLTTPNIGVATATSINKVAITAPATGATLTVADGKTFTAGNTLTLTGTDGSTVNFGAGGTLAAVAYSGSASDLLSGILPSGRLSGSYTGITGVGTLGAGTWQATAIGVAYGGTGTNLSATGGASQVLQQSSVGGAITVAQLAASDLSNGVTGSGALVLATSPTLVTPTLGAASATSINKVAITTPAVGSTLTIANGKTLTANASLTFAGSDGTTMTFPTPSGTVMTADSTATQTNKTFDTAGTGNVLKIAGVGISAVSGTGAAVLVNSPALMGTPTTPTATPATGGTQIASQGYADASSQAINPLHQVFLTPGANTFTPTKTGIYKMTLKGGGGAGVAAGAGFGQGGGGGGAGAEGIVWVTLTASTGYAITVGAAGVATTAIVGANTYTAGAGATGTTGATTGAGGAGGTCTGPVDINYIGADGAPGIQGDGAAFGGAGGNGGNGGAGAPNSIVATAGSAGRKYGAGGGGGSTASAAGGAAQQGIAIIEWIG